MFEVVPSWVENYIGIPFETHGRTPSGCDCWGLVKLVLEEQFGIIVNGFEQSYKSINDTAAIAGICCREVLNWKPVTTPQAGDVILLRMKGMPQHVGIVVADGWMLHSEINKNAVVERYGTSIWKNRILGYYRHVSK